jgi:hypothetical protein
MVAGKFAFHPGNLLVMGMQGQIVLTLPMRLNEPTDCKLQKIAHTETVYRDFKV